MWDKIPKMLGDALTGSQRDFVTLECCANAPLYSKPDTQKEFLLWEVRRTENIHIELAEGVEQNHPWLYALFIKDQNVVRFPFNTGDSEVADSVSWGLIQQDLLTDDCLQRLRTMPRFSTASRSCLALIPQNIRDLAAVRPQNVSLGVHTPAFGFREAKVNVAEWQAFETTLRKGSVPRFRTVMRDMGKAANEGISLQGQKYRLYSVKTGASYVGSNYQGGSGKHRLEANSSMAMVRSRLTRTQPNKDRTFGIQGELLTVTAPLRNGTRDGFQVRDLSCLRQGLSYLPAQAIPYVRLEFDRAAEEADQVAFWRNNFAIPLGRAKGRLFLQYGLVHTSANAQNFVLGFSGHALRQFVARDLGDTSWHDDYLQNFVRFTSVGGETYTAFNNEKSSKVRHTLRDTSSGQYPAPQIVRLATYSVLTHGFGEKLGWSGANLLSFVAGVLEGFRAYIEEALQVDPLYGAPADRNTEQVRSAGTDGRYPHPIPAEALQAYKNAVRNCMQHPSATLFSWAAYVHANRQTLRAAVGGAAVSTVINSEELFLCAGVEKLLTEIYEDRTRHNKVVTRLNKLLTSGEWPSVIGW